MSVYQALFSCLVICLLCVSNFLGFANLPELSGTILEFASVRDAHASTDTSKRKSVPAPKVYGLELLSSEDVANLLQHLHPSQQGFTSWTEMRPAVEASLAFVKKYPTHKQAAKNAFLSIEYGHLLEALQTLHKLLPELDADLSLLEKHFTWVRILPDVGYTGYYIPSFKASRHRTAVYTYPVYAVPKEASLRTASRHNIDCQDVLRDKGLELAWLRDPFDVLTIQIQGSGKLVYPDGKETYLLYAGNNGRSYTALGGVMRDKGLLDPSNITMDSIRAYLAANPKEQEALYDANTRYVYFRLAKSLPVGSTRAVLTPWVSVATDTRYLPFGSIAFMQYAAHNLPHKLKPFAGLMLAQDSGYAIKKYRVDIFCGSSAEGEKIASSLDTFGPVVMLVPKDMLLPASIRISSKQNK